MCVTWLITNQAVDQGACDLLASSLQDLVLASYGILNGGFACTGVDAGKREVTACADFATEAGGQAYGSMLDDTGFDMLKVAIGFGNVYVNSPSGPVCDPSAITATLFTKLQPGAEPCGVWRTADACAPPSDNGFPYCKCDPRLANRTPYSLSFKSKSSRTVNGFPANVYCFTVKADKAVCGSSRCCNMDLEKVEWLTDMTNCRQAAVGYTVSLKPTDVKMPVWARQTDTVVTPAQSFDVFKTNQLGLTVANANGAEICLILKQKSSCPTLDTFCHQGDIGCQYAVFDKTQNCCAEDWSLNAGDGSFSRRRFRLAL